MEHHRQNTEKTYINRKIIIFYVLTYSNIIWYNIEKVKTICLWGRVKFLTDGIVHEPLIKGLIR